MTPNQFQSMKPNRAKALMLAKHEISTLVYNAIQLEDINFTLPEVQTILDGITIGGQKLSDQNITANQGKAWQELFLLVKNDEFRVDTETAFKLHDLAGREEAFEQGWNCGKFRTGGVLIAGTEYTPPSASQLPDAVIPPFITELFSRGSSGLY